MHAPQIAQDLDAMERAFMQEGGVASDEYLRFAAEESGNVAADGMFSIQVRSMRGMRARGDVAADGMFSIQVHLCSVGEGQGMRAWLALIGIGATTAE